MHMAVLQIHVVRTLHMVIIVIIVERTEIEEIYFKPELKKKLGLLRIQTFVVCCETLWLNLLGLKMVG